MLLLYPSWIAVNLAPGYYASGKLVVEPPVPSKQHANTTSTGDLLSVCLMLLHAETDVSAKLRFASQIATQFIEERLELTNTGLCRAVPPSGMA